MKSLKTITNDGNGRWMVQFDPMPFNTNPQSLTISGKNTINISNILVGDVWLCSGQSNMKFGVRTCLNAKEEIANANYPMIRQITLETKCTAWPLDNRSEFRGGWPGKWHECNSKKVGSFSAAVYFFAREIFNETGIPIGLISTI